VPERYDTPPFEASAEPGDAKRALRRRLLAARRAHSPTALEAADHALGAAVGALPEVGSARTVACYVSGGSEPPTTALLQFLWTSGRRVLCPVLLEDDDLEWSQYGGQPSLRQGRRGTLQPSGALLGRDAVAEADVVVVPGLAAGRDGTRLGRGGGSYDRALGRLPAGRTVVLLLHEGELLDTVPVEPHDRRVDVVVTPSAVRKVRP
jgi:5-formyltetrahydrofolate cyclo-ligase